MSTPSVPKPAGRPDDGAKRGPEAWLFYLGAAALLFAMVTDAVAVIGRHIGLPLLGSIELVQASMLVAASAAIVSATVAEKHAVVHLLLDRLSPTTRGVMQRVHNALCASFFLALAAGSIWIAFDLRGGHEESELLSIPYAPLRVISVLAVLGVALVSIARIRGRRESI